MDMIIRMQVYVITFVMLLIIYVQHTSEGRHYFLQHRLFKLLILSTMVTVSIETVGWLIDGHTQIIWPKFVFLGNILVLACYLVPMFLWMLYVDFEIHSDMRRLKNCLIFFAFPFLINAGYILVAPAKYHYFYVDANSVFQRGSWSVLAQVTYYVLFGYNLWVVMHNWKNIKRRNRWTLATFSLLPLFGLIVQSKLRNISLIWPSFSLSLLIVYITMQNQAVKTDYLTGLYNRRQLDYYLNTKIKNLSAGQQFAGIMIDIDHFKHINDQFGHISGDRAIEAVATLLRSVFKRNDFIARYAGDEFVVLFDINDKEVLDRKVTELFEHLVLFNEKKREPFEIQISLGTAIYSSESNQTGDEFLDYLDRQMYKHKRSKKTHQSETSS